MKDIATIILAAGEGTRMKSSLPKVLHNICGKPMLEYLIDNVNAIGIDKVIVIVGHKAELVKKKIRGISCIKQDELLGTADAVSRTRNALLKDNKIDNVLILYGDTPLLSQEIIKKLEAFDKKRFLGALFQNNLSLFVLLFVRHVDDYYFRLTGDDDPDDIDYKLDALTKFKTELTKLIDVAK